MEKKIRDILPPDSSSEKEPQRPVQKEKIKELPRKIKGGKKGWFIIGFLLLVGLFVLRLELSKAEIKISPETNIVSFETDINISKEAESSDFQEGLLKAEIFEATSNVIDSYSSSGETQKKAEGIIRLYNNYTTKSEDWLEGTRFISDEGKLFKSKGPIEVPGAEIKNGEMVPNYVDVPVVAAEPGEDYNIKPSHFSIFVFRGTPRYTKFYGESLEPMKGGGKGPQVTIEDIEKGIRISDEKAKRKAIRTLEEKLSGGFVFLTDLLETEALETSPLAEPGDELAEFELESEAKAAVVTFRKTEIEDFSREFIRSRIPEDQLIYDESLKIEYTVKTVDLESGEALLSVDLSATIYPEIDFQVLKRGLVGKSLAETKIFLENQSGIKRVEVDFSPFWVESVPQEFDKINIVYPILE